MADLKVTYMGIPLKNPVIAGSSSITNSIENLKEIENAGFGAVILRSLFEEEIAQAMGDYGNDFHPEAYDYDLYDVSMMYGHKEYLELIETAKSQLNIPVLASINCLGEKWWVNYSKDIEAAGADGIEINLAYVSFDDDDDPRKVEEKYIDTVEAVKEAVNLPISIKISQNFTSIPNICKKIQSAGANAVTLFNRYYKLGIDIDDMDFMPVEYYSSKSEMYNVLRWIAILSKQLDIDISATTGAHDADAVIQQLLAGATTVQVASKLFIDGISSGKIIIEDLNRYMDKKNINNINELHEKMDERKQNFKEFERVQYMKIAGGNI
jgi:dihydroorotate dehydrogenase (fumarate)